MPRALVVFIAFALMVFAQGCASSGLLGKVIEGDVSFVAIVDADDERLAGPGLVNAVIKVKSDPARPGGKTIADGVSDANGGFSLSIDGQSKLGGQVGIGVKKAGFSSASGSVHVPGADRRVLVIMARGASGDDLEDPDEMLERFK